MRTVVKWLLLASLLFLLGIVAADKADMSRRAAQLVGVDATAAGAVCNPDWVALNPIGCRFRFNLAASEFDALRKQQLTPGNGWQPYRDTEIQYPALNSILTPEAQIYANHELPTRVRWVVFLPAQELLYLGYYSH